MVRLKFFFGDGRADLLLRIQWKAVQGLIKRLFPIKEYLLEDFHFTAFRNRRYGESSTLLQGFFIDPFEPRRKREYPPKRRFGKTVKRKHSNKYYFIGNNLFINSWTAFHSISSNKSTNPSSKKN